jgi:hypothetical protein
LTIGSVDDGVFSDDDDDDDGTSEDGVSSGGADGGGADGGGADGGDDDGLSGACCIIVSAVDTAGIIVFILSSFI